MNKLAATLCRRFEAEPNGYDPAMSTCIILYHFAYVVAHVRSRMPHDVAEEIAARVPAFHRVRAITNAGKHVEAWRRSVDKEESILEHDRRLMPPTALDLRNRR